MAVHLVRETDVAVRVESFDEFLALIVQISLSRESWGPTTVDWCPGSIRRLDPGALCGAERITAWILLNAIHTIDRSKIQTILRFVGDLRRRRFPAKAAIE